MTFPSRLVFALLAIGSMLAPGGAARASVLAQAPSVALGDGPVRVPLGSRSALSERVRSMASGRKIWLVVRQLHADIQPGVVYSLYLDLPAGSALPADSDPRLVGTINFYAAVPPNDTAPTVSFDITKNLIRVLNGSGSSSELVLAIVPAGRPIGHAVLGSVELIVD